MTMITFENDQQRSDFRMRMALVALQSEATQRQKDTGLFVGIMGVSLAIIYATTQIFN